MGILREPNASGTTIISSTTHYRQEAESLCRNIAIIDGGRIVEADRMDRLLRKLHSESFVLVTLRYLARRGAHACRLRHRAAMRTRSEVEVTRVTAPSTTCSRRSAPTASSVSLMRNKVNRLEEIFMRLVDKAGTDITPDAGAIVPRHSGAHP